MAPTPRWWTVRRAQSTKPATYRCPFCGNRLPAMSEHVLIKPEGNSDGRRHAHAACAAKAHKDGRLPTLDDWRKTQPKRPGALARLLARIRSRGPT